MHQRLAKVDHTTGRTLHLRNRTSFQQRLPAALHPMQAIEHQGAAVVLPDIGEQRVVERSRASAALSTRRQSFDFI